MSCNNKKDLSSCASSSQQFLNSETKELKSSSSGTEKTCGCNEWTSVPENYDIKESCSEHKKSAGNNEWCSCNK